MTVALFVSKRRLTAMTDNHTFPVMADVEKLREHYIALPPMLMDSACDDDERVAFLIGVH